MRILDFLSGKKTYIIGGGVIAGAVFLLLTKYTVGDVPPAVWLILNGLGFGAIRAGIDAVSPNDNKGWKTNTAALGLVVLGGLKLAGVALPEEILGAVITALEGIGIVGIRAALNKIG